MKKKLLIIGASSCLAHAISGTLNDSDYLLIGTYNNHYPQDTENYKSLIKIDFNEEDQIKKIDDVLSTADDIVFTIGESDYLDEEKSSKNVTTLKNLLDHLKDSSIKNIRVIFCSSSSVYGDSDSSIILEDSRKNSVSIYGKNKLLAEETLHQSGIPYIIIRFPIILGKSFKTKFIRLKEAIIDNKAAIFGDGNNRFSFIHEKDLTGALLSILEKKEIKNIDINLSDEPVKQKDFINQLYLLINKEKTPRNIPISDAIKQAEKELENFNAGKGRPSLFKEDVLGFSRDRAFDCTKAKKLLDWNPQHTIKDAAENTFNNLNFIERSEGVKILKFLFPNKTLPVKIYKKVEDFKISDFQYNDEFIWSVTIRDDGGSVINTGHLFSRNPETIRKFMIKNSSDTKSYSVRISPVKEDILYYGSFLIDNNSFGDKAIITLSKKSSAQFTKSEKGESFKLLPRDIDPEIAMEYLNGKFVGNTTGLNEYLTEIANDIENVKSYMQITRRENLIMPLLFIINKKKGVQYISMGF